MSRKLGAILLILLLVLAACGGDKSAEPTRASYAVVVDAPEEATATPPPPPLPTAPNATALVTVDILNVRGAPSADAELIGQVRQGDVLTIVDKNDDGTWLRVDLPDGTSGWISAEFVRQGTEEVQAIVPSGEAAAAGTAAPVAVNALGIPVDAVQAQLVEVVDGRTIKVSVAGAAEDVRYLGIDTPGSGEPGYRAATAANQGLLTETLYLAADRSERDGSGRLLRYVYTDAGVLVNAEMVGQGWALPVDTPPDTAHVAEFLTRANEAAGRGLGFWGGVGADGAAIYALAQGNIKVREGPGTDYSAIDGAPDGTPLAVLGRTRPGSWLRVRLPDGSEGWVSAGLAAMAVPVDKVPVAP